MKIDSSPSINKEPFSAERRSPTFEKRSFSIFQISSDYPEELPPQQVVQLSDSVRECVLDIPIENFTETAEALATTAAANDSDSSFSVEHDISLDQASELPVGQESCNSIYPADKIVNIPETVTIHCGLKRYLQQIFESFRSPDNEKEIDSLIEDRVHILAERNIDAEKLAQLLHTAEQRDTVIALLHGAVQGAAPFAVASLIFDLALGPNIAKLTPNHFVLGAVAGAFQALVDIIAGGAMQQAFDEAYYTKVTERNLSPMMLQLRKDREANLREQIGNMVPAVAIPYTMRNALRAVIAVGLTATAGPASVPIANLVIDCVGGLGAGAGMRYILNRDDQRASRMHTAYLLARTDWLDALTRLDEGISVDGIKNAGAAIISALADVLQRIPGSLGGLASAPGLAELVILTGGVATLLPAQEAAAQAVSGHGAVAGQAAKGLVHVVGGAGLYAGLAAGISAASAR